MNERNPSSCFTNSASAALPFGPPLIGALLRIPWEAVQRHMLQRLHERGFDDLDAAHLNVFQYPGPQGARPSELATRLGDQQAGPQLPARRARAPRLSRTPPRSRRPALQARRPHPTRHLRGPRDPRGGRRDGDHVGATNSARSASPNSATSYSSSTSRRSARTPRRAKGHLIARTSERPLSRMSHLSRRRRSSTGAHPMARFARSTTSTTSPESARPGSSSSASW